jgi:hypothetical protein
MAEKTLSSQTVTSLAGKLDEFAEVLTPEEHGVLLGLLGMASATLEQAHSGVDTEGYTAGKSMIQVPSSGKLPSLSLGLKDAFRSVPGMSDPLGPISDSIGVGVACVSWSKDYNKDLPGMGGEAMRIRGLKQTR